MMNNLNPNYQNNVNTNQPSYLNNPFNHSITPLPMNPNINHTVSQQPSSYIENNNYSYQNTAPSNLQQLNMVPPPPTNQFNNQMGNLNPAFDNKYSLDNLIQNPLNQATSQIITSQYAPPQTLHQPLGNITNMNYPGSVDYNTPNPSVGYLTGKSNNLFNPNIPTQTQYQENQNPSRFNGTS